MGARTVESSIMASKEMMMETWQLPLEKIKSRTAALMYRMSVDDLPDALTQAKVMDNLVDDPDDTNMYQCKYAVCKDWYRQFLKYLGHKEGRETACSPGQTRPPGQVEMNTDKLEGNVYIEGYKWRQLLLWYGCSQHHELDRHFFHVDVLYNATDSKGLIPCKIAFLNALLGRVKHRTKSFFKAERVGYVEFQIRRILQVRPSTGSRLWVSTSSSGEDGDLRPLFDREQRLFEIPDLEKDGPFTLALEVQDQAGYWPSGYIQPVSGSVDKYEDIVRGYVPVESWKAHHSMTSNSLKAELHTKLNEMVDKITEEGQHVLADSFAQCEKLFHETRKTLLEYTKLKQNLEERERKLKEETMELHEKQRDFLEAKRNFENGKKEAEQLNKITDSMVTLNVGGHIYQTSKETLTSDPDSMLNRMFSGMYNLRRLEDGSYFIDRDGRFFQDILAYLRKGECYCDLIPDDDKTACAIYHEADYFQLRGLQELLASFKPGIANEMVFKFSDDFFCEDEDEH